MSISVLYLKQERQLSLKRLQNIQQIKIQKTSLTYNASNHISLSQLTNEDIICKFSLGQIAIVTFNIVNSLLKVYQKAQISKLSLDNILVNKNLEIKFIQLHNEEDIVSYQENINILIVLIQNILLKYQSELIQETKINVDNLIPLSKKIELVSIYSNKILQNLQSAQHYKQLKSFVENNVENYLINNELLDDRHANTNELDQIFLEQGCRIEEEQDQCDQYQIEFESQQITEQQSFTPEVQHSFQPQENQYNQQQNQLYINQELEYPQNQQQNKQEVDNQNFPQFKKPQEQVTFIQPQQGVTSFNPQPNQFNFQKNQPNQQFDFKSNQQPNVQQNQFPNFKNNEKVFNPQLNPQQQGFQFAQQQPQQQNFQIFQQHNLQPIVQNNPQFQGNNQFANQKQINSNQFGNQVVQPLPHADQLNTSGFNKPISPDLLAFYKENIKDIQNDSFKDALLQLLSKHYKEVDQQQALYLCQSAISHYGSFYLYSQNLQGVNIEKATHFYFEGLKKLIELFEGEEKLLQLDFEQGSQILSKYLTEWYYEIFDEQNIY